MAYRRRLIAAAAASLFALEAAACEVVRLVEYDVRNGGYQIDLNGVYLDHGGGQFASGGLPFREWLLEGENIIAVRFDGEEGRFQVRRSCADDGEWETLAEATLTGRQAVDLRFDATGLDPRLYHSAASVDGEGLLDAVATLADAYEQRDFATVWSMHRAMRDDFDLSGRSLKSVEWELGKIVDAIVPRLASGLVANPVLSGRVWEVYGDDFAPPISADVEMNGGVKPYRTGSFWMKVDGVWSVLKP